MRGFKSKWFRKWAAKNGLKDKCLRDSIGNLAEEKGAARLGVNLYKLRVARTGGGKRGGFRTIVVYVSNVRAIYVYGFAKNERDNIPQTELKMFRELAKTYTEMDENQIELLVQSHVLFELEKKS